MSSFWGDAATQVDTAGKATVRKFQQSVGSDFFPSKGRGIAAGQPLNADCLKILEATSRCLVQAGRWRNEETVVAAGVSGKRQKGRDGMLAAGLCVTPQGLDQGEG